MEKNKKTLFIALIAVFLCGALFIGGYYMFRKIFSKSEDANGVAAAKPEASVAIESFDHVRLRLIAMRFTSEYEIVSDGAKTKVELYSFRYSSGKEERILENSVVVDTAEVIEKLNEFCLCDWDGFVGEHPKNVSDGVMFELEASVNGEKTIRAHGSENFPEHYHELVAWLDGSLKSR